VASTSAPADAGHLNSEHPNATAYRQAAAAFRAGDLATIEARWIYPENMNTWESILRST
jgi:hypothetical protein